MRTKMRRLAAMMTLALAGLLGSSGCQGYVFEPVLPGFVVSDTIEIEIPQIDRFDLLFVVDDSGSMAGNQTNLAANLDTFILKLEDLNALRIEEDLDPLDFQIGVASTSLYQRIYDETRGVDERRTYTAAPGAPCLEGTAYHIEPGDPYPDGVLMAAGSNHRILTSEHFLDDPTDALRQFRENIRLGTCGSGHEQGLEGMRRVLLANPGFFRPQSRLVVVFLSDEEDASDKDELFIAYYIPPLEDTTPRAGGAYTDARLEPSLVDQLTPVSYYKQFLDGLARERGGSVAIASIVSAVGTPPRDMEAAIGPTAEELYNCEDLVCAAACEFPDPNGSPCFCGGVSPGSRYLQLARMYSDLDHIMDSICQTDFSDTLDDLIDIIDVEQCFQLTSPPHDDDLSLVMVRIEREGERFLCESPKEPGKQACDEGADWYLDDEATQPTLCLCDESRCRLEPGDSYRLSIIAEACSPESPCTN